MDTPRWLVSNKIDAIGCQCEAEDLRRGINCKICKLMLKVDNYMMNLFRDAAEGRAPGFFFR
jgi:hypothetical protein